MTEEVKKKLLFTGRAETGVLRPLVRGMLWHYFIIAALLHLSVRKQRVK